jgi:hypothetical protein
MNVIGLVGYYGADALIHVVVDVEKTGVIAIGKNIEQNKTRQNKTRQEKSKTIFLVDPTQNLMNSAIQKGTTQAIFKAASKTFKKK